MGVEMKGRLISSVIKASKDFFRKHFHSGSEMKLHEIKFRAGSARPLLTPYCHERPKWFDLIYFTPTFHRHGGGEISGFLPYAFSYRKTKGAI